LNVVAKLLSGVGKPVYRQSEFACGGRIIIMHRLALGCAVLAFGILGSPAAAQQALAGPATPAAAQVPSQPQAVPLPEPPPFPPIHKAKPSHRTVDLGNDYPAWSTQHSRKAKPHTASAHKSTSSKAKRHTASAQKTTSSKRKSASNSRHKGTKADRRTASAHQAASRHETVHASRKTIKSCHAKSYTQIMKDSTCRALMRQDLEAADRHKSSKHEAKKHDASHKKSSHKAPVHKAAARTTKHHTATRKKN
jgi:hypothetical protein